MAFKLKKFNNLDGIEGFSKSLIENHLGLYEGYVTNINKLDEKIISLWKSGEMDSPEFSELKRRSPWEFNGMRLHELYFENMVKTGKKLKENSFFLKKLNSRYGSIEKWQTSFKATGMMRGIGWVILYYDKDSDNFYNVWINEHDVGHFVGAKPILVMDVFEHAYMLDYGTKKAQYIDAFLKIINWQIVEKRFEN